MKKKWQQAITIRNLPDTLVKRIKNTAKKHSVSMEQELRELLKSMFMEKNDVLDLIRKRWDNTPAPSASDVKKWRDTGRE
jgi:antitoxin FitA